MKRLGLTSLLLTLFLSAAANASLLRGTVTWVDRAHQTVAIRDVHRHLYVLHLRGATPRPHTTATFQVRRRYAVLVGNPNAFVAGTHARRHRRPKRLTPTVAMSAVTAPSHTSTTAEVIAARAASAPARAAAASASMTTSAPATPTTVSATTRSAGSSSASTSPSTSTPASATTATTSLGTTTSATPSSVAGVPAHIETWAYDDGCNGGTGASASLVQSWLTYAESNCGPNATKAQSDCHSGGAFCTALAYLDANKIYAQNSVPVAQSAQESWWLHQPGYSDSAHRVVAGDSTWGNSFLLNQGNPAVQSWFQSYARTSLPTFDGLMMDDTNANLSQQFYGTGQRASQEISADSALMASHEAIAAGLTKRDGSHFLQVDNSLNANPWLPTPFALLGHNDGVHGFVAEGQPISGGSLTPWYASLLDDLSYIDAQPNAFIDLLSYDNNGSLSARRLQAATVLLGYSPGHVVSWADLEQSSSNLAVWPEEGLYPTQPVQSMGTPGGPGCLTGTGSVCASGGHNDVQVARGVYRREFAACYDHRVAIGRCATIVNDTSSPVVVSPSWLTQSYGHQITMVGGDVQSGGSLDLAGAPFTAGTTTVPANDAMLISG